MDLIYPQHFTVRSSPECAVVSSKLLEKIIEQDIPELTARCSHEEGSFSDSLYFESIDTEREVISMPWKSGFS